MKKDNIENKDQNKESQKTLKKSSYSKKKKAKKNIINGIAYVQSTFNNTIVSIADTNGNVVSWASAGQKGFKGSRKSTPYAAQVAADSAAIKALEAGMKILSHNYGSYSRCKHSAEQTSKSWINLYLWNRGQIF